MTMQVQLLKMAVGLNTILEPKKKSISILALRSLYIQYQC